MRRGLRDGLRCRKTAQIFTVSAWESTEAVKTRSVRWRQDANRPNQRRMNLSRAEKMHESQGIRTDRTTRPPPIQGSNPAGGGGRDISVATSSSRADNSSARRRSRGEISLRSGETSASGQGSRVTLANSHSHPSAEFLPPPPGPTRHRDGDACVCYVRGVTATPTRPPRKCSPVATSPMLAAAASRRVSYSPRILGPPLRSTR